MLIYGSHHALFRDVVMSCSFEATSSSRSQPVTQQVPHRLLNKGLHRVRIQQVQAVHLRVVPRNDCGKKQQKSWCTHCKTNHNGDIYICIYIYIHELVFMGYKSLLININSLKILVGISLCLQNEIHEVVVDF